MEFTEQLRVQVQRSVAASLAEDIGTGDLTARLVQANRMARGRVITREDAILCGTAWFDAAFMALEPDASVIWHARDGERIKPGQLLCEIDASARALLTAERTGLNFVQLLSGTATMTATYVQAVAGTGAKIVDTRKTLPGLRLAQKYAVRCGGGHNHRIGLYDAVMLKENHIRVAGSVAAAIAAARAAQPDLPLIVEVETLEQLRQALETGCDRILVDDFSADDRRQAVRIARSAPFHGRIPLEVSGGVDLAGLRAIAEDGVDFISIGALTKHVRAVDLSMKLGPVPA